nr:hypothetical protein GCM10020185_81890 [Pseudomonas brassicacearum subsp. brassicacearum]
MQAALNRVLAQIQEVMGRERRFIADAAHEMRTPLAVLRVHAQNLMEAGSEQSRRESLEHLIAGVDRTTRLVNQLLTMARLEPQAGVPTPAVIDLPATVRASLVQLTPWLLSKGLEPVLDVSDDIGPVRIDPVAIDIALNNLVTNAANFFRRPTARSPYAWPGRAITTSCQSKTRGRVSTRPSVSGSSSGSTAAAMTRGLGWA